MKESIFNYLKKNKNKPPFIVLKFILKIFFYPVSNVYLIRLQENCLRFSLRAKLIREFWLSNTTPHFSDLRASHFLSHKNKFPPWLNRGFYSREVVRPEDTVLDIGCGNGFFVYFFLSDIASQIDAIDINEKAIRIAKKHNYDKNIHYYRLDAIKEPFPGNKYDVIIMDSSIMYFKENDMDVLMNKILRCMDDNSLFVGSATMQSLENTDKEHLQTFHTIKDMETFLLKYFTVVSVWSHDEIVYKQVYFRCAKNNHALEKLQKY